MGWGGAGGALMTGASQLQAEGRSRVCVSIYGQTFSAIHNIFHRHPDAARFACGKEDRRHKACARSVKNDHRCRHEGAWARRPRSGRSKPAQHEDDHRAPGKPALRSSIWSVMKASTPLAVACPNGVKTRSRESSSVCVAAGAGPPCVAAFQYPLCPGPARIAR